MKSYRVLLEPPALEDLAVYHARAAVGGGAAVADAWFNRMSRAIQGLANLPMRAPQIPEQGEFSQPLRQLVFERRYRVIFMVEGDGVHVVAIRGLGMPPIGMSPAEVDAQDLPMSE